MRKDREGVTYEKSEYKLDGLGANVIFAGFVRGGSTGD